MSLHHRVARGFTLIELLVSIAIIGLLVSIILPSLAAARDRGQEVKCGANLRQLGMGFITYAGANGDYFCSGSFDPEVANGRDGPVDRVGWVADLVNSRAGAPAEQLCPSNPARYNQKLGPDGHVYNDAQAIELVQRGYNTNYTQSWYMGRTQWNPQSGNSNVKRVASTFGGMNMSWLKSVDASRVPLMGDGRTDLNNLVLGERSVKTMTDGPYGGTYGIQSYADFGPAHGRGSFIFASSKRHSRTRALVLFADGHTEGFLDADRDGEFALDDTHFPNVTQRDLEGKIFDGVLSIGRRSLDAGTLE